MLDVLTEAIKTLHWPDGGLGIEVTLKRHFRLAPSKKGSPC